MGIFAYIKRLFSKDFLPPGDINKHLVLPIKTKKGRIWLGKKLVVPENFVFYFAKNGKLLDQFNAGQHEISPIYITKAVKALGLDKKAKKGDLPKWFVANSYYVNMQAFPAKDWKLFARPEFFDAKYGYFSAMLKGEYIFKVQNPTVFLSSLLKIYDYLNPYEAEDLLEGLLSEFIFGQLTKSKLDYNRVSNADFLTDYLFDKAQKHFVKLGVEILGLAVNHVKFPKRFEKKIRLLNLEGVVKQVNKAEQVLTALEKQQNLTEGVQQQQDVTESAREKQHLLESASENEQSNYQKLLNLQKQVKQAQQVDLKQESNYTYASKSSHQSSGFKSQQSPYNSFSNESKGQQPVLNVGQSQQNTRVCSFCGESNANKQTHCVLCGEKLN